jgi:hypothetical protein
MKTLKLITGVLLLCVLLGRPCAADDNISSTPFGRELISLGLKFLDDPGDFFFNLHSDNEDFSPVTPGRHGSVRFNFFPTFIPATWGNLSGKVKLIGEGPNSPEIDFAGMYGLLGRFHSGQERR